MPQQTASGPRRLCTRPSRGHLLFSKRHQALSQHAMYSANYVAKQIPNRDLE